MKKLLIISLLLMAVSSYAVEYIAYEKMTGEIIAHSGIEPIVKGNTVTLGGVTARKVKWSKYKLATVAVWVDGATNISQLGPLTPVVPADEEVNYDIWSRREKAMLKLLVKEINTLRGLHGLPARTKQQVMNALKNEL